jgi:hypothetical protein
MSSRFTVRLSIAQRNGGRMMSPTQAAWMIAATLLVSTASVQAGPCTADIAQFENTVRSSPAHRLAGPTGQQTVAAQLGRQPTPDSVRRAEEQAQAGFEAALAHAKALDTQGREAECAQALRDARLMLDMP